MGSNVASFITEHLYSRGGYLPYPEAAKWVIAEHCIELGNLFSTLGISVDEFFANNGTTMQLLKFKGTIPVHFRGSKYNIPIEVWVNEKYPSEPPTAFVVPTATMAIKASDSVDHNGQVTTPLLHPSNWSGPNPNPQCNLVEVVLDMARRFGQACPLFTKPSTSSSGTGAVAGAASGHHANGVGGYGGYSQTHSNPNSNPNSNSGSGQGSFSSQGQNRPNINATPSPHYPSIKPPPLPPPPPPPPADSSWQHFPHIHSSSSMDHMSSNYNNNGPSMFYQGNSPLGHPPSPSPSGPPPPSPSSYQTNLGVMGAVAGAGLMGASSSGTRPPPPPPSHPPPPPSPPPPPPSPPPPSKAELERSFLPLARSALRIQLMAAERDNQREVESQTVDLLDIQKSLGERKLRLQAAVVALRRERQGTEGAVRDLSLKSQQISKWLEANEPRAASFSASSSSSTDFASIVKSFGPKDDLPCQALDAAAEDLAIEDATLALDSAMSAFLSGMPPDVYLKLVRSLGRRQFFARAIATRASEVMASQAAMQRALGRMDLNPPPPPPLR